MNPSTTSPIRVALLDRQALIRAGLRLLVESNPRMEVAGEAGGMEDALVLLQKTQPDIVLVDFNLGGCCAGELIHKLLSAAPSARVILVTGDPNRSLHLEAIHHGAVGLVLKEQPAEVLLKAIEKVHKGEVWLDRMMVAEVLGYFARPKAETLDPDQARIATLSPREREVIQLIGKGHKNREIARQLSISEVTVRHHLTSIFSKLEVEDRLELIIFAYKFHLAELPQGGS